MPLRKKNNILWTLLGLGIIVNVALFGVMIFPYAHNDYKTAEAMQALHQLKAELADLPDQTQLSEADFTTFTAVVPLESARAGVLRHLAQFETESNVTIQSLNFRGKEKIQLDSDLQDLSIMKETLAVHLEGPFEGMRHFMHLLLAQDRIVHVKSWDMNVTSEGADAQSVRANILIEVYAFPDESFIAQFLHAEAEGSKPEQGVPTFN